MANKLSWIYNAFNFLEVWLPYGKEAIVYDPRVGTYEVTAKQLTKKSNTETLVGIDITVFHPENSVVTPENFKKVVVGTCLGKTRYNLGVFEVKCLIKDLKTINLIKSKQLTETSAVYISDSNGNCIYNSIAIVPTGYARLGRKMTLKAEAANHIIMNPEDLKAIAEAVSAEFKVTEAEASAFDTQKATLKAESFAEGLKEGKEIGRREAEVLSSAKGVGYEGVDASEASNFLIDNQFPGLRSESMGINDLMLLVQAAMKSSSPKCEACGAGGEEAIMEEAKEPMAEAKTMAESLPESTVDFGNAPSVERKQLPRRTI